MKKIISLLLVAIMVVSTLSVITIPTVAADGLWSVYTAWSQELLGDDYNGVVHNRAGYKYEKEGLVVTSPDSTNTTPYVLVQTTDTVDLKEGVYMKVRVDDFTYEGDSLFAFTVWDQQGVEAGKQGKDYGLGVEALIRPNNKGYYAYDPENKNTWPGSVNNLNWFSDIVEGSRVDIQYQTGTEDMQNLENDTDGSMSWVYQPDFNAYYEDDGTPVFVLEIKYNPEAQVEGGGTGGYLEMYINGAPAVPEFNIKMTEYFKPEDFMAHIGFTMYNSAMGGKAKCTILEWGTDKDHVFTPVGDDSRDPEILNTTVYGEPQDGKDIELGQPAIFLTGDPFMSDAKGLPSAFNGNKITLDDEGNANIKANSDGQATISYRVNDEINYNVKDFPICLIITKNFCTCEYLADEETGMLIKKCALQEKSLRVFANAGNHIADDADYTFYTKQNIAADEDQGVAAETYMENFVDNEGNSYLYFMADFTDMSEGNCSNPNAARLKGRIHGVRIDVPSHTLQFTDNSRNNFDVCQVAFFRNVTEASEYAKELLLGLCGEEYIPDYGDIEENTKDEDADETETETTEENLETDTEVDTNTNDITDEITEEKTEEMTEENTVKETEKKDENPAEKETKPEGNKDPQVENNTGCGGTIGISAIAIVALAGAGLLTFRKKED